MTATHTEASFSALLRERTTGDHRSAERSPFMTALLAGELPRAGYVDMLAQHRHAYDALESTGRSLAADPVVRSFLDPALLRLPALDADLADLAGTDWASTHPPSAATERYVTRLRELATWPGGFVAHHYTRYLGDLSGGQFIGRLAATTYDLTPEHGGRFARFDGIEDPAAFKADYRQALDDAPWDPDEQRRVVDEIREAYRLNGDVFADLEHHVR